MLSKFLVIFYIVLFLILFSGSIKAELNDIYLNTELLSKYEKINQDENLIINTEIVLVRTEHNLPLDVIFLYKIYNEDGKSVFELTETESILFRSVNIKKIKPPPNLLPGAYILEIKAVYKGVVSKTNLIDFEIIKAEKSEVELLRPTQFIILFLLLIIIFIFILSCYYEYRRFKYLENVLKKVNERDLLSFKRGKNGF